MVACKNADSMHEQGTDRSLLCSEPGYNLTHGVANEQKSLFIITTLELESIFIHRTNPTRNPFLIRQYNQPG